MNRRKFLALLVGAPLAAKAICTGTAYRTYIMGSEAMISVPIQGKFKVHIPANCTMRIRRIENVSSIS